MQAKIAKKLGDSVHSPPAGEAGTMLDESLPRGARLWRTTRLGGLVPCLVCLFVFLVSARSEAADLLITRGGKILSGALKTCVSDLCQLDERSIPRNTIAWIGLGTARPTPPPVKNPAQDEVRLANGSVHEGHLVGVSLGVVAMQEGSFDRAEVTWIHLASAPAAPHGSMPTQVEPPVTNPPPPRPPQPSGGKPQPPSGDGTPVRPPTSTLVRGALWSGTLEGRETSPTGAPGSIVVSFSVDIRLREWVRPLYAYRVGQPPFLVGTLVQLEPEGTVVRNKIEIDAGTNTCKGEGTVNITSDPHTPLANHGSVIWLKTVDVGAATLIPLPPTPPPVGLGVYQLALVVPREGPQSQYTCVWPDGRTTDESFMIPVVGKTRSRDQDQQVRTLDRGNGRMQGSYSGIVSAGGPWPLEAKWNICREGVDCSGPAGPPPAPPAKPDPCPSTAAADAFAQRNRDRRKQAVDQELAAATKYLKEFGDAEDHHEDFRTTAKVCLTQTIATKALILMLEPEEEAAEAGEAGGSAYATLKSLKLLPPEGLPFIAEVSEKLVGGEDPNVALLPEANQMLLLISKALTQVGGLSPDASAAQMEQAIEGCAGTIGVSAETKLSAEKYVEDVKELEDQGIALATATNKIRQLDTDYPDLQYKAYAACVERARCEKTPESDCDVKKPSGNWPPVP